MLRGPRDLSRRHGTLSARGRAGANDQTQGQKHTCLLQRHAMLHGFALIVGIDVADGQRVNGFELGPDDTV
ncbi:MAG: hypothetical protein CVV27_04850 [Candidatus Melainabacteria bacterium HGW-Melainabacteria-1]|nr:MAG: hypothetical protein CVV27_04850 [Candidatus Melainabacteria bacterium HGW-Melainabacteria-1]